MDEVGCPMSKRKRKPEHSKRTKKRRALPTELRREDVARVVYEDERRRVLELSPVIQDSLQLQLEQFREKFGREPGPDDPLFFDPDADEPRPLPEGYFASAMADFARTAGISEAKVYAIRKTGMMIVDGLNDHLFSEDDKAAWEAAIKEFKAMS